MKISWGICVLFYSSVALALLIPALHSKVWKKSSLKFAQENWMACLSGLVLAGAFCLLAAAFQLQIAGAWMYLLGVAGLYGVLSGFNLSAENRGLILLAAVFAVFSGVGDVSDMQLPLLASLLGLAIGKLYSPDTWKDFILPGTWLVGLGWLAANAMEASLVSQVSLLTIFLSIGLILRAVQVLPVLAKISGWLRPVYLTMTGGLAAWLAVQNMLLQPELLSWVGLFSGSVLLGFLLLNPQDDADSNENIVSVEANQPALIKLSGNWQGGVVALVLLGLASLVASRLFGTVGWLVLVTGLMVNRRIGSYESVAALFLLGRILLQLFLTQYSANVTGINITHPYASAALYAGFAVMMLLPAGVNALQTKTLPQTAKGESESSVLKLDFNPLVTVLLGGASLLMAGLSNYFLHGEATASLLLALLVSGLGAGFFAAFNQVQARALPMFVTLLTLTGVLATPEILDWGNSAEKSQKLLVLGAALAIVLLIAFLTQQIGSGRKPVQVS